MEEDIPNFGTCLLTKRLSIPSRYLDQKKKLSILYHYCKNKLNFEMQCKKCQLWICNRSFLLCRFITSTVNPRGEPSLNNTISSKPEAVCRNLAFLKQNIKAPRRGKERSAQKEIPGSTVSQAEWCENPIEFPARQVYSPASSKVTFRKYRISSSLSVVLTPAVYGEKKHTHIERGKTENKPHSQQVWGHHKQISKAD